MKKTILLVALVMTILGCTNDDKDETNSENISSNSAEGFSTVFSNNSTGYIETAAIKSSLHSGWISVTAADIRVIDGDTVEFMLTSGELKRVRLIGIDAPESSQIHGTESRDNLKSCTSGGDISIVYKNTDSYGRLLGKVLSGKTDCNFMQVATGSAWHYKKYAKEQPNNDSEIYSDAEKFSKLGAVGLWGRSDIEEPWNYRKR